MSENPTAAVLVIGDEILSGRTQDTNTNYIAKFLGALGIDLKEARTVSDVESEIVAAVNALRARYTYVFTTGGIGPTHDDITADAIAAAFGVGIDYHPEALALLSARYKPGEFNEMRKRMARVPLGASLVKNSVSTAPGFQIENVFVMAGVPMIMRAMLEELAPRLSRGVQVQSITVSTRLPEGRTVVWGRSAGDCCGHPLDALDLVPLASWVWTRGHCRHCHAKITPLYPLIELGALAVAIWAATVAEGWLLWASCGLGWCLLALAIIDLRDGILPDALTLPLIPLGLGIAYFEDPASVLPRVIGAVSGFAGFAFIRWAYRRFRGREGLGLGDVKLLAAAGAWVGWDGLPSIVLIGAMLGLAGSLIEGMRAGKLALDQRLPFGPGLCLGIWLVWLYGPLG